MNKNNGGDMATNESILSSFLSCTSVNRIWKALLLGMFRRVYMISIFVLSQFEFVLKYFFIFNFPKSVNFKFDIPRQ